MKRTCLLASSAALLAAVALAGCAGGEDSDEEATLAQPSAAPCRSTQVPAQVASGAVDIKPLPPDALVKKASLDYPAGTTSELLNSYPLIALVQATTREKPVAVQGKGIGALAADAVAAAPPAVPGSLSFRVVRPMTLQVVRELRGDLPTCLELAIPGGSADGFAEFDPGFPRRIAVGEPMLAFFSGPDPSQSGPVLTLLVAAQPDGTFVLPFGDGTPIEVATWTVPPYAPPVDLPGGFRPRPGNGPGLPVVGPGVPDLNSDAPATPAASGG